MWTYVPLFKSVHFFGVYVVADIIDCIKTQQGKNNIVDHDQ